jgi:hypothetical protein
VALLRSVLLFSRQERSAEAVQEERENLRTEMEKLQNNLMSREKVVCDIIIIFK